MVHRIFFVALAAHFAGLWPAHGAGAPPAPAAEQGSVVGSRRILFTHLTSGDGLTEGAVGSVVQDKQGFIWIGTDSGLNRYDGYEIRHYRHDKDDPASLSGNDISAVHKDTRGNLWIGTHLHGLNRFDTITETITRFRHDPDDSSSLTHDAITCLQQDHRGNLWIGTSSGLNQFNLRTEKITRFTASDGAAGALPSNRVCSLFEDSRQRLWVGTLGGGMSRFDPVDETFVERWDPGVGIQSICEDGDGSLWVATKGEGVYRYTPGSGISLQLTHRPGDPGSLASRDVETVFTDSNGVLWAGTARGLCRFDSASETITTWSNDPLDSASLIEDAVVSLYEDKKNVLWAGTRRGGLSRFHLNGFWFPHVRSRPGTHSRLSHDSVWGMAEDAGGAIWIGTESGISILEPETGVLAPHPVDSDQDPFVDAYVLAIREDQRRQLWIGTKGAGLKRVAADRSGVTEFLHDPGDPDSLGNDTVTAIEEDRNGDLWIATEGCGLARFEAATGSFVHYRPEESLPFASQAAFITDVHEDTRGRLWLGSSGGGLFVFDRESAAYIHYTALPEVRGALSSPQVSVIGEADGVLWIGTLGGGLNRFDPGTGDIAHYTDLNSGLPHRDIYGLVVDDQGFLWISTANGIARFDPTSGSFRTFDVADGLQGSEFHSQSFLKDRRGRLYFGGANGFNIIDPGNLPPERQAQRAILTGLELFGERVLPSEHGILKKPLALTDTLKLPFDKRNRIAFWFATLNYATPHRSTFRFRLDGLEQNWTLAGTENKASYTGLAPGRYTFLVESSRDGARWNQDAGSIKLEIQPPWHQTWWARLIFAATLLGLSCGLILIRARAHAEKIRRQREALEVERNRAEAALARQLQHAMLLGQTNQEFRRNMNGDEVFAMTLNHLGAHFKLDRCHIHSYTVDPEPVLFLLAEHRADGLPSIREADSLTGNSPLVKEVLAADNAVVSGDVASDPLLGPLRSIFERSATRSFAAVRTSHLDQPNGIIMLEQCAGARRWQDDELQLLEAVAGQVGIAIAHLNLARREEEQRQELESAKRAAEIANHAKSDFLAKMTHELRTPLNSIIGFSEMIAEDPSISGSQREFLDIINHSGEHLLDVINNILEMSKIEAGREELQPERFDLEQLLTSVCDMLKPKVRARGLEFQLLTDGLLPARVLADKGKLRQVLINLIGNALKFTETGCITLKAGSALAAEDVSAIPGELVEGERRVTLSFEVRDTGKGISESELPTLFQKFVQTESGRASSQGTGLGLAITRNFVELMGGSISAESLPGKGTTFAFHIHCLEIIETGASGESEEKSPNVKTLAPGQDPVRILVADDQPMNRLLAVKILEKAGFEISEAQNGAEAIQRWRDWKPHLIFMDEEMPVMRGQQATRAILEEANGNAPVIIALTAFALDDARKAALEAGSADFLSKPFTQQALFEIIGKHLGVRYVYQSGAEAIAGQSAVASSRPE